MGQSFGGRKMARRIVHSYEEALRCIERDMKEGKKLTSLHVFVGPEIEFNMED
jgi:hypothetical protein